MTCGSRTTDPLFSAYRTLADVLDGLGRSEEAANLRGQLDRAPGGP
ncbi:MULTISPECIES: hypothetical protein [Micromonospora]|nr:MULTISPECIES: hypothetical protein [Micromonospora]WFE66755.1 hypothetical protein O7625_27185 [Micromonospora sp. WMMD714]